MFRCNKGREMIAHYEYIREVNTEIEQCCVS